MSNQFEYNVPIIECLNYYARLNRYSNNHFGFMNFNPPLAQSTPYPYMRSGEKMIEFQPSYDTLMHNGPYCDYASIKTAYSNLQKESQY